jgi:hypothetical protein
MNAAGGVRFVFALRFAGADASRGARISREACARIILRAPLAFERPFALAAILRAPFALAFGPRFAFACVLRLDFVFVFAFDRAFATAVSSES